MTNDPFTTAARAESERRFEFVSDMACVEEGTEWARDHLAAQEPTDAEAEGAAVVIWESYDLLDRAAIRDALSAARAARRDEEKR